MEALRRLILRRPACAAVLLAAALALRLLVPAGFMPGEVDGGIRLVLCPAAGPIAAPAMAMAGMHHGDPHQQRDAQHGAEAPCAYAGLSLAPLTPVDPLLLAAALAFVMAVALIRAAQRPPRPAPFWRPPLRGPPVIA